jgi:RNA polymerase sigma-70 factor (ECF subfamily)
VTDLPLSFQRLCAPAARDDGPSGAGRDRAQLSDEALARHAAADRAALEELIARYHRRVAQFVRWTLADAPQMVDDVVQEVLLEMHKSIGSFAGQSTFRTWLYGLARNVCRYQDRKIHRGFDGKGEHAEQLCEIADEHLGPFDALARDEVIRRVRAAVETLTPDHRLVLMLCDWEDLSYAEIAAVLGVPVGTVRSRLHNARVLLGERLADLGGNRDR